MKDILLVLAFLFVVAGAVAAYQYITGENTPVIEQISSEDSIPESPIETPIIRFPVPARPETIEPAIPNKRDDIPVQEEESAQVQATETAQSLPGLDESDNHVLESLSALIANKAFSSLFNINYIIRRFVTTVDNLSRKSIPRKYLSTLPVAGQLQTATDGGVLYLNENNYNRYLPLVRLLESVDIEQLVSVYIHFYPLFQVAYEDLGYPSAYFNDRLIDVIDLLLATPDISRPIQLVRPRIMYQYADPELEKLASGQKIIIRMGQTNAAIVKTRLLMVRKLLAR